MKDDRRYSLMEQWSVVDDDQPGKKLYLFENGRAVWATRREIEHETERPEFWMGLGYDLVEAMKCCSYPSLHYRSEYDKATATVLANREHPYRRNVEAVPVTKPYPGWVIAVGLILLIWLISSMAS